MDGPLGIVIVRGGHPEDGHEAVAHDLRHRAPVFLDDEAEVGHPRSDGAIDLLRVEGLGQGRVARQVGEEDGHDLALRGQDRLAAGGAGDRIRRQSAPHAGQRSSGVGEPLAVSRPAAGSCHSARRGPIRPVTDRRDRAVRSVVEHDGAVGRDDAGDAVDGLDHRPELVERVGIDLDQDVEVADHERGAV